MIKLHQKNLLLLLFVFCLITITGNARQNAQKTIYNTAIFVDTRLMVMAHPLFKAFDPKTQRFKGTSSESFQEDFGSRLDFIQKTKDLGEELLKSPEKLKEKLKGVPFKDRINVEREFLLEKKMKESKLESMKRRVYLSRLVPTKDGLTPYESIYPQCRDLAEAIKKVTNLLKEKYKTEIVIDVANIFPFAAKQKVVQPELRKKIMNKAYQKQSNVSQEELSDFMRAANSYWAAKLGMDADIIPVGAKDVRLEAVKLMEEEGKGYKLWNWQE